MGVHGLWRLVEPSGKSVPLETLENKVLAVDVSLWLHQAVKGFQDSKGGPVPNAHLLGIYHRVCKLLYFKVKPVFIFDGGVPVLKHQTIVKRNQLKSKNTSEADRLQKQLLDIILKHSAISKVISEKTKVSLTLPPPKKTSKYENMYALPPSEHNSTLSSSENENSDEDSTDTSPSKHWDLHTIDMSSAHFKSLPVDVRHEILTDLKETRKQNSWGRLHELPKQSDDFAVYQMKRLLKRQAVQSALEDAEKEMGGHSLSLAELESILKDHGVAVANDIGKRIASDENTRYLLIKDVKQAMANAKREQLALESQQEDNPVEEIKDPTDDLTKKQTKNKPDLEFEEDLQKAITLSLQEEPSTSTKDNKRILDSSFLENFNDADFLTDSSDDIEEVPVKKTLSSAHSYMIEYSGLTPNEIAKIMNDKSKTLLKKSRAKKDTRRRSELTKIQMMSDSDESDEFVEVATAENKSDTKKSECRVTIESDITKASTEKSRIDTISDSCESNPVEVSVEKSKTKNDTNLQASGISTEKVDEVQIISDTSKSVSESSEPEVSMKKAKLSNRNTKQELIQNKSCETTDVSTEKDELQIVSDNSKSALGTNESIEVSVEEPKVNHNVNAACNMEQMLIENQACKATGILMDKDDEIQIISDSSESSQCMEDIRYDNDTGHGKNYDITRESTNEAKTASNSGNEIKKSASSIASSRISNVEKGGIKKTETKVDNIEIMSDSGESSSSTEFFEVSEGKQTKNSVEIVINPNQEIDMKNDLFGDIFDKGQNSQKKDSLEIVIRPHSKLEDDLFSDVFEGKPKVGANITPEDQNIDQFEIKHNNLRISKEEEVLVIKDVESCSTAERKKATKNEKADEIDAGTSKKTVEVKGNFADKAETKENQTKKKPEKRVKLNLEQMKSLEDELQKEKKVLLTEKSTKERRSTNITDQMYEEAQDLLELFGVPYIVAPLEAEAQCAFLDEIQLTDGTITDDSDIWLFGGKTVYKNVFHQGKYVMEFTSENIKHHFKLTREQMVLLALLVGSDYTTGVQGIGPVTALEVLAAFPASQSKEFTLSYTELTSGLQEFQSWLSKGKTAGLGRTTLKNKLKNVSITDNFPSVQVIQAYLEPNIDTSREAFSWSKPDFVGLTDFAKEKFGWSTKKTEEILKPVLRRIEEKRTQKSIKDYFKTTHKVDSGVVENQMSKRVKTAVGRIGKTPDELIAEEMEALSNARERKISKENKERPKKKTSVKSDEPKGASKEMETENKPKPRRTRNKRKETESIDNATADHSKKTNNANTVQLAVAKPKKSKKTQEPSPEHSLETVEAVENGLEQNQSSDVVSVENDELKQYENIAIELKKRRQRRNEMSKMDETIKKAQVRPPPKKNPIETIPEDLEEDEEVQFLKAITSTSLKRVEEIDHEVKSELDLDTKKKRVQNFHKKEVIHQKLRDKSDVLRNKLKAIEVFRKSKKGPGYVQRRKHLMKLPKEDAALSENSSDE